MRVTIAGCGNSGLIHAAKLIEKGYRVGLLKTSTFNNEFHAVIKHEEGYIVKDQTNYGNRFFVKPEFITTDFKSAIEHADIIFICTVTLQHEDIAKRMAPYISDGQIIVLIPGYMGSLIFKKYITKDVTYCEWETTAYNGRIIDDMYVKISYYNTRNAISVLPISRQDDVLDILSKMFDNTKYLRDHILESTLHNPNYIVHTIGMIFSASRIEYSKGEFWMYKEGFTPSVINFIEQIDIEKNAILSAFGCETNHYFDVAKWRNEEDLTKNSVKVFRSFAKLSNKGPSLLHHRYLLEDIPMGLCLLNSIARVLGISTHVSEAIITSASVLLNERLDTNARTIEKLLGTTEVTKELILERITQ